MYHGHRIAVTAVQYQLMRTEKRLVEEAGPAIEPLLGTREVSEWLKVPEMTLYQWNYKRVGPPVLKVGKHLRYRRNDVERWLDQQTVGQSK